MKKGIILIGSQVAGKAALIDAIAKLLRISIVITAGLVILQTLGYSISGVLAFGGIGGIGGNNDTPTIVIWIDVWTCSCTNYTDWAFNCCCSRS